jgi:3-oxoacyl-[acyl-carrier protein] reductase
VQNKVVIVTGGAVGIGRATYQFFARAGAHVAIWDVDGRAAPSRRNRRAGQLGGLRPSRRDELQARQCRGGRRRGRWGQVDVLVNNAGIVAIKRSAKFKGQCLVATMSDETFDVVIDVNLKGVFHCTRAVVPHMVSLGGGVVLNASSVVGLYGNFGQTNYAATKGAVITMTRTWARELGKFKVRVNCVCPGFIATEILKSMPKRCSTHECNTPQLAGWASPRTSPTHTIGWRPTTPPSSTAPSSRWMADW